MRECIQCGGSFILDRNSKPQRKFCNRTCSARYRGERRKQIVTRGCLHCGIDFTLIGPSSRKKFCSRHCCGAYYGDRRRTIHACSYCGKAFKAKQPRYTTYCSRDCCFEHRAALRQERASDTDADREQLGCAVCGNSLQPLQRRLCGRRECRLEDGRRRARDAYRRKHVDRPAIACAECNAVFVPRYAFRRQRFCSRKCTDRYLSRIYRAKRRALERGADAELVDPIKVFERDGWRCHMCRVRTPRYLRGTIEDRAPELDHIVPFGAKDGQRGRHRYDNVACACRKCNRAKGARPLGQLRLAMPLSSVYSDT
jgi:hypothetical protein